MSEKFTAGEDSSLKGFRRSPALRHPLVADEDAHQNDGEPMVPIVGHKKPRAPRLTVRHKVSGTNRRARRV